MRTSIATAALLAAFSAAAAPEAQPPAPIPAAHFANANGLVKPLLSPDGSRYAGMVRTDTRRALVSRMLDGSDTRIAFTLDKPDLELELLRWLGNERLLLRLTNYQPGPVFGKRLPVSRLVALDLDGSKASVMYDARQNPWTNYSALEVSRACPAADEVLLEQRDGDGLSWVERIDSRTGKVREAGAPLEGVGGRWWADAQGRVRLAQRATGNGSHEILLRQPLPDEPQRLGRWQTWRTLTPQQAQDLRLLGFDADPQRFIVHTRQPDGNGALQRWALDGTGAPETLVHLDGKGPPDELLRNESDCRVVGARRQGRNFVWGDALEALVGGVAAALPETSVELLQWQGDRYLARASRFDRPHDSLVGQRKAGSLTSVAWSYERLPDRLPLQQLTLEGGARLLRPAAPAEGIHGAGLPLLVCLRCELHDADVDGFEPLSALLAQRGYAVLQLRPVSRGGEDLSAEAQRLGAEIEAQLREALRQPGLDGQRIGLIAGDRSAYFGLLWAQRREPALRAVIARGALTNLLRYRRQSRESDIDAAYRAGVERLIGSLDTAALEAASPALQAARLRAPTLLLHGDHDARVALEHATDLKVGLEKAGLPVRLIEFAHSDSELDHPPYRREAFEAIEAWLAQHL